MTTPTPADQLRDRIAALFRHPPGAERLGDATPGEIADAVMAVLPETVVARQVLGTPTTDTAPASAPAAPADRATVLREAAASVESGDTEFNTEAAQAALKNGGQFALLGYALLAVGAHLRRLADEAQPTETEAHPTEITWIGEMQESDGLWGYLRADCDRAVVEKRTAQLQERFPAWNDGTPIRTRIVRKTTTYTVEPATAATEEPQP